MDCYDGLLATFDKRFYEVLKSMTLRKKPDFTDMERKWQQLAPMREKMEDLPNAAK